MSKKLLAYLITDPHYYSNDPALFKEKLHNVLQSQTIDMACFRDKSSANYEKLAEQFIQTCQHHGIAKILLNEHHRLAIKLNAHGVHLTSQQFHLIPECKAHGLYVVISCHTKEEIQKAQALHADAITYSPIFNTPNKGAPKGIENLQQCVKEFTVPIIALGGIVSKKEVHAIEKTDAQGFASIRFFING